MDTTEKAKENKISLSEELTYPVTAMFSGAVTLAIMASPLSTATLFTIGATTISGALLYDIYFHEENSSRTASEIFFEVSGTIIGIHTLAIGAANMIADSHLSGTYNYDAGHEL